MQLDYVEKNGGLYVFYRDDNQAPHLTAKHPLFIVSFSKKHDVKTRKQRFEFIRNAIDASIKNGGRIGGETTTKNESK